MINKKKFMKAVFYFISFTLLFPIIYLYGNFPIIYKIYNYSGLIIFFLLLLLMNKKKFNFYLIVPFLFFLYLCFLTYYKNGELSTALFYSIRALSLCYLFDYGIKKDKFLFINAIKSALFIIIFANFISMLLFNNGIYRDAYGATYWLLGNKNNFLLFVFPLLFLCFSSNRISQFDFMCIILSSLTIIMSASSTSILFLALLYIFFIFHRVFKNYKIFNIKNYIIVFLILFFVITVLQSFKYFEFIIVDMLGKDITLTNRVSVWNLFLQYIKLNPLFGYGIESNLLKFAKFGVYHAHSEIYEIIYETGIVGFVLLSFYTIPSLMMAYKNRKFSIVQYESFIFFCYLITMISEFRNYYYFLFIFAIFYNCNYLVGNEVNNDENTSNHTWS